MPRDPSRCADDDRGLAFVTLFVVTASLAVADPAGTVALGGTVAAAGLSLDSDTTKPPEGAATLSLSVPVAPLGRTSAENAAQLRADAAAAIACLQSSSPESSITTARTGRGRLRATGSPSRAIRRDRHSPVDASAATSLAHAVGRSRSDPLTRFNRTRYAVSALAPTD